MNVRMMEHVRASLSEADVVAVMIDVSQPFGHGDEFVLEMMRDQKEKQPESKRFAILNKIDLLKKKQAAAAHPAIQRDRPLRRDRPRVRGDRRRRRATRQLLLRRLGAGEAIYPKEDFTTQPERFFAAEIVREKVLQHTSDELPYTTAVAVDRWEEEEEKNLIKIYATIVVERETQKPIIIGKRGDMIKRIGTEARVELEAILGARVFLDLHVAVHGSWREDERFLGELDWPLR